MATQEYTLTESYQEITVGAGGYLIIQTDKSALIHFDKATAPGDADPGIAVAPGRDGGGMAVGGLAGKKVWAKRGKGFGDTKIVVATW